MIRGKVGGLLLAVMMLGVSVGLDWAGADTAVAEEIRVPEYRLQISPSQANVGEMQPGETYTGMFRVQNTGEKAYSFDTSITPYSVKGNNYEPFFNDEGSKFTLLREWITIEGGEGEVQPGEEAEVKYSIVVPKDVPAGNQNAAIAVTMRDDSVASESGVKTVQQASFVIFTNVAGETREDGEILENKIPNFLFNPPVVVSSVVKNMGNVYTRAEYKLEIRPLLGGEVAYTNAEAPDTRVVFPETERYNEIVWENAPQLGVFKVKQTIKMFGEVSEAEKIVFICPMWFLAMVVFVIGLTVFWLVSRIVRRRQEKQRKQVL